MALPKNLHTARNPGGGWLAIKLPPLIPLGVAITQTPLLEVPAGSRILDMAVAVDTGATNASGTTTFTISCNGNLYIGATPLNAETGGQYVTLDTATTGGDATAKTRPRLAADTQIILNTTILSAAVTGEWAAYLFVEIVRDDYNA